MNPIGMKFSEQSITIRHRLYNHTMPSMLKLNSVSLTSNTYSPRALCGTQQAWICVQIWAFSSKGPWPKVMGYHCLTQELSSYRWRSSYCFHRICVWWGWMSLEDWFEMYTSDTGDHSDSSWCHRGITRLLPIAWELGLTMVAWVTQVLDVRSYCHELLQAPGLCSRDSTVIEKGRPTRVKCSDGGLKPKIQGKLALLPFEWFGCFHCIILGWNHNKLSILWVGPSRKRSSNV